MIYTSLCVTKTENRCQSKSSNMWYCGQYDSSRVPLSHVCRCRCPISHATSSRTISIASLCREDVGRKRSRICSMLSWSGFVLPTARRSLIVYNTKTECKFMPPKRRFWKELQMMKCEFWFGLRTIEKSIESPHFIFCSVFQNLRLGTILSC